jgi:hypothetical protein
MKRCLTLPLLRPSRIFLLPARITPRGRGNPDYSTFLRRQ